MPESITTCSSPAQTGHSLTEPPHFTLPIRWISKAIPNLIFVVVCFCIGADTYALEKSYRCNETLVVVTYENIEDYQAVCDSVNDIAEIADKIGIDRSLNISVLVVQKFSITHSGTALALFKQSTRELQVLSFEECERRFRDGAVFGQKIDKELYMSIVIHELAHALAWENSKNRAINREMMEYFAYAIQIALLDSAHREKILFSKEVEAFSDKSEITEEYYYLNPDFFAIKSYLYFASKKNRWAHLRDIFR